MQEAQKVWKKESAASTQAWIVIVTKQIQVFGGIDRLRLATQVLHGFQSLKLRLGFKGLKSF